MVYLKAIIHDCVTIDGDHLIELHGDKAREYKQIADKINGYNIKNYPALVHSAGITILEYNQE